MKAETLKISMIGCWYKGDIYSHHLGGLIDAMKSNEAVNLRLVTSNCNCFSSSQRYSITKEELLDKNCSVIKLPFAPVEPNRNYGKLKYYLVKILRMNYVLETFRGFSFFMQSRGCDIIHFDQVLRSFGILSFTVLLLLSRVFGKKVIVTVHELDPLQVRYRRFNRVYNKADRIIVFSEEFATELTELGVRKDKMRVIPYAVSIEPLRDFTRDKFIFFGGHKLLKGKGFDTLLSALKLMEEKGRNARVVIYVGQGCIGLEEGKRIAADMGLNKYIRWSEFLSGSRLVEEYQKSIGCLIPYTSGSGRYPATSAMANATPVIATRKASLPEYLGDSAIYIKEDSPQELADAMTYLMDNPVIVKSAGDALRKRAEKKLSKDMISKVMVGLYKEIT